jgi:hypothetical protein
MTWEIVALGTPHMSAEQFFPVKFTHSQRTVIAELIIALAERLKLDEKNQRVISFTKEELQVIHQKAKAAIGQMQNGMRRNSLRHAIDIVSKAIDKYQGVGVIPITERVYQFKITLKESRPSIWRRIRVKEGTLDKLHEHIQTAMGWTNSHLHQFQIDGERYGDPELLECGEPDFDDIDSLVTKISEIVPKDGKRFRFEYEYDFGDCWMHEVVFEGCLRKDKGQRYPLCLEGERACPPEDVGGIRGYAEFLKSIADPENEDHDRFLAWSGPFDAESFDADKATKAMRRGLPDWRRDDN